ncbi:unnamed protein product, partial [Discosporangium mesarthrocarpum]
MTGLSKRIHDVSFTDRGSTLQNFFLNTPGGTAVTPYSLNDTTTPGRPASGGMDLDNTAPFWVTPNSAKRRPLAGPGSSGGGPSSRMGPFGAVGASGGASSDTTLTSFWPQRPSGDSPALSAMDAMSAYHIESAELQPVGRSPRAEGVDPGSTTR